MLTRILIAALLALTTAAVSLAQEPVEKESGEFELTLSPFSENDEDSEFGPSDGTMVARLELELGLTDRLRLRAEMPLTKTMADDLEIGFGYDFSGEGFSTFVAGFEIEPGDLSEVSLQFESDMVLGRAEIYSQASIGVGDTRDVMLELSGGRAGSNWRGTLELLRQSEASGLRIIPGVARKVRGVWIGMGATLPSGETSKISPVLKIDFDF